MSQTVAGYGRGHRPTADKTGRPEGVTSDPLTTRAQEGQETEICASPEGGSAPSSNGNGTTLGDRPERPAEVRGTGHNGPVSSHILSSRTEQSV